MAAVALCTAVIVLLAVPAVLLQVGLRDDSAPWFHVNDSTYQIELAGELVRHGHNPYGHDYDGSGLERFYSRNGTVPPPSTHRQVALTHFAYFPGTALTAAVWGLLPSPFDDYRVLVLLATIGCFFAVLLFDAPLPWRLAVGVLVAANPLLGRGRLVRHRGRAERCCALLLAFALLTRRRYVWAAVALAAAVLLKQFALVALPFFALMFLARGAAAADAHPGGRGLRRGARRRLPAVPDRRRRARSGATRSLRRRHVPHHRLRALGAAANARRARRPLRRLPVRAARAPRLAAR